ncbi:MAG: Crp/Fnr family transcriptional regulator [Sphingosinicella sp.]
MIGRFHAEMIGPDGGDVEQSLIARRFARHFPLTPAEIARLRALEAQSRSLARNEVIRRQNGPAEHAFILQSGWAMTNVLAEDGSRQILRLHLPGDMMAMPSVALQRETENLVALSDCRVSSFTKIELGELFIFYPRLAAAMFLFAQLERVMYADRLASVANSSAKARIAFILLDILHRLRWPEPSPGDTFELHLTREQMAEMTGMTAVHASRMWTELCADGMIASDGAFVTIRDEARLSRLSGYLSRSGNLDFSWLPPAASAAQPGPELIDY